MALESDSGSGLESGDGVPVSIFIVGRIVLNYCFKWTFVVAGEIGR